MKLRHILFVSLLAAFSSTGLSTASADPAVGNGPAPAPTGSPGPYPARQEVGPSTEPGVANNNYTGTIDTNGHRNINVCSAFSTACASVIGLSANDLLVSGIFGASKTKLSATSGTCTNSFSGTLGFFGVLFASSSAQTGTLTIYDEATAACTATDAVYVSATHGAAGPPDVINIKLTSGLTYEWTTAGEAGSVYALTY